MGSITEQKKMKRNGQEPTISSNGSYTYYFVKIFIILMINFSQTITPTSAQYSVPELSQDINTTEIVKDTDNYQHSSEVTTTNHITQLCIGKCPEENATIEHLNIGCGKECDMKQCALGCSLWETALETSCQVVCNLNRTADGLVEPKVLYCVMGCNDALTRYFKWLRSEVGTPSAPALVADTLTATSLSLEWEIPPKLLELIAGKPYSPTSYLVQWRYEEVVGDWKFCRNQSMGDNSTVRVDNLQPYTKYRFRVALLMAPNYGEVLVSEQSVIISTLAMGKPLSKPSIVRAVAVDHARISVSWEAGPFPNGPILSYVLQIKDFSSDGVTIKDIPESENTNFYMFDKLSPSKNYSVHVSMRNIEGEGPAAEMVVTTPPQPPPKDDEPEPRLILGAEYTVLSQGSEMLTEPEVFYHSEHLIKGIAIHIAKQLLFVSDEAGFIYKAPLEEIGPKKQILTPQAGANFLPLSLSMDWLNNHLYVLGEVIHSNMQLLWQISRCDLEGNGFTVAIAGLRRKPSHIEVDPYNGYLFWVIPGDASYSGLFRLDLGDISNGVKHEVKPLQMIQGQNLGAFVVDHTRFRIVVANQRKNTVISVSLDGKDQENIRKKTQRPKFDLVKSLALANGIFYWTNGVKLLREEHHVEQNSYYHNDYDISNETFVAICVNLSSAQPVPVPVNPPRHVQALLSANKAKIQWRIPHLLGNQGKGAWQDWTYELEIIDDTSISDVIRSIKGIFFTADNLKPNINYTFRAAAYTAGGKGPWSTEFRAKTLKSSHDRYLIWSASDGLLQSDIIGDNIETLVSKSELEHDISDMAWFEDMVFLVSNSTLKYYNRTSKQLRGFNDLDSVGSIGVDWIGRRIYWSNPTQQTITRARLDGTEKEPLPIIGGALTLKIDSIRAHIYYSTAHAVEVCRLNGKNRTIYFSVQAYVGKQVMGLTLDMENERVFWIVRSYEGSSLFNAPMADKWNKRMEPLETVLEESSLNGPLTHFSDRLLWLQDNQTVIVGDMAGKNLAHIRNSKLCGLKSIAVIDPTHQIHPNITTKELNVIPEMIDVETIEILGNWKSFKIFWDEVETVTYGEVFYEIRIDENLFETTKPSFTYSNHQLLPYSELSITIRAFTFWGSGKPAYAKLHSPPSRPSAPLRPRVFVIHNHNPFKYGLDISFVVRWDPPADHNGPIVAYEIFFWYLDQRTQKQTLIEVKPTINEIEISEIIKNKTYQFQIKAYTSVGGGPHTLPILVNPSVESPMPKILAATQHHILNIDLDLNTTEIIAHTANVVTQMTYLRYENKILWLNENGELIAFNGTKTKLAFINAEVQSLAVDWIERIVYWIQVDKDGSSLFKLDLNRVDGKAGHGVRIFTRPVIVRDLVIAPNSQTMFWLEYENSTSEAGELIKYDYEKDIYQNFTNESMCFNGTYRKILLDTVSLGDDHLLMINHARESYTYALKMETCNRLKFPINGSIEQVAKDSSHIYSLNNNTIFAYNHKNKILLSKNVTEVTKIFAYFYQHYPPKGCLTPKLKFLTKVYIPELVEKAGNYLLLQLPQPEVHQSCKIRLTGVKYMVAYSIDENVDLKTCQFPECQRQIFFDDLVKIENLKPYTKYRLQIGINNYYGEKMALKTVYGPVSIFPTAPGAPSAPRNVSAEAITPTEALIYWLQPLELNSDTIWYEVHWKTENPVTRVVNKQQRLVSPSENLTPDTTELMTINLSKLLPSQSYTIYIQAYTTNNTFSISPVVLVETFSEPENITVVETSAYSLKIQWRNHMNISQYILEYKMLGSDDFTTVPEADDYENSNSDPAQAFFMASDLQPKTQYIFSLRLFYAKRNDPYLWPADNRFTFETFGDCPTAPGRPIVHHVSGDVYKVSWEPAKENGASIEEYSLDALLSRTSNRSGRSAAGKDHPSNGVDSDEFAAFYQPITSENYTSLHAEVPWAEEPEPIEEKWTVYYTGTDSYWIVKDLQPINIFSFRVRARNAYGWGPYSSTSEAISELYISATTKNSLLVAIFVPVLVVAICCFIVAGSMMVVQRRSANQKKYDASKLGLPDLELANLRELPRGGNFIQSNNILYTPAPLTDADIALLPQLRRDQITMSSFLGSGAFGEVYEGVVRYVGEKPEIRVAIKTLRKGATEQEKGEFLKEAQLMSNFKHDHILRLIGVCFESESLYIIMELMQGGDLLSYLRQSRPTVGMPTFLTLLDLISMCVDVASGCRYLEEMHFVHRDLACRNCLVSSADPEYRLVKIGDFGLARDIYKNDYYRKEGEGLLPVRWMSPESLVDGVFTSPSDIWAFGVLCWEIMTLGQQPYPARNNLEVLDYVRDGGRLGRPIDCPDELYDLMLKCWSYCPENRPTFRYCLEILQSLRSTTSDALEITAQTDQRVPNGGIFNPSYWVTDQNHNHHYNNNPVNQKFEVNHDINAEPPVILTPASSTTSTIVPKYLELLYDENYENDSNVTSIFADGYEVPLAVIKDQDSLSAAMINSHVSSTLESHLPENRIGPEKERTFSSSSTASRSSSPVLGYQPYEQMNAILKVALLPSASDENKDIRNNERLAVDVEIKNDKYGGMESQPIDYLNTQHEYGMEGISHTIL